MFLRYDLLRAIKHYGGNLLRFFYHRYLRAAGVIIGNNTMISLGAKVDVRRGKVIIGNRCTITHGCVILSHDAAAARLGKKSEATTIIEDNVFIGVNSVVLPGVRIGRNSIVGAGSVVTCDVSENSIVCGNPAKLMRTLDNLYQDPK